MNDLRGEGLHSGCCDVRLHFQQRVVHEFETVGSLNSAFFESVLVVYNRLTNGPSSTARYRGGKTYVDHPDDDVQSTNRCLEWRSTKELFCLLQEQLETMPGCSDCVLS